jgi:signal transduction histidine kinase/CheY-like chemotaxis protein
LDPVTFLIELLFAAVFVGAVVRFVRGRDPLAIDVILVFSGLATIFAVQIAATFLPLHRAVQVLPVGLLLAQPFFTLRLVGHLRSVPRWLLPLAGIALLLSTIPLVFLALTSPDSPLIAGLGLALIATFVVTEIVAAGYLAAEARRRVGSARIRLGIAAVATAGFAVAILAAVATSVADDNQGGSGTATQVIALLSGLAYVVAFLPPPWLRHLWQASAAYGYGQEMMTAPVSETEESIWHRLVTAASQVAGSDAAVLLIAAGNEPPRIVAVAGPKADRIGSLASTDIQPLLNIRDRGVHRIERGRSEISDDFASLVDARFKSVVSFPVDRGRVAILVHLSAYASLFGADDSSLLVALGRVAALLVERRAVLAEQESLTQRLTATVAALEAASEAKSDFVASMSHELRTPLTAIIGFSDLMRGERREGDSAVVPAEWIEHINRSGNHLLGLINDVLDLAKVEAGRLDISLEQLDLSSAVLESVAGMRPLADRKSIAIYSTIEPIIIEVDRGRLRQILYNLLSNAIKFTPDGGRISIEASRLEGEIALVVSDTGVGIAPEDVPEVFEEFRQVGDIAARQPGTGLGLALSRRLVEAHGGRIELESTVGVGSRFTVFLPAAGEAAAPPAGDDRGSAAVPAPNGESSAPAVLMIEDDPSAVRLIRTYLEVEGYRVRVAPDGETGLAQARSEPPDAIVLDVLLSGIDGWEVLRRLKSDERLREIPVVIVTIVDEREVGLALGAVDYLVKPVNRTALLDALARYTPGPRRGAGIRVLAIDDDPATLDMIEATLGPDGHDVTRATSGQAGLEIARSKSVDLVICDLLMPDLDGFGVVAELGADPRTHDIPILILTAHELSELERSILNGKVLGVAAKGATGTDGLRDWLNRAIASAPPPAAANGR